MRHAAPPSVALWLLTRVLSEDDFETIAGDLEETFVADVVPRLVFAERGDGTGVRRQAFSSR